MEATSNTVIVNPDIIQKNLNELRLSVSKTKTFLDCKKKFHYVYKLKMPKVDHDYLITGTFCHKVLEDFHNVYINGSTQKYSVELTIAYKAACLEFKDKMTKEMRKECWDILNQYLKIMIDDKKNNRIANVLSCEEKFYFNIRENVILNGMIDRIQIDPDGVLHVADYKTTKNTKYLKDDTFQLLTYAYVMYLKDPTLTKVRASYVLLRHNFEYITFEFSVPEILTIKDKYLAYADKIIAEVEYPGNPTFLCNWCDFKDICESAWKPSKKFGESAW